ncbi:MAG TPA: hypothetical protein VNM16_03125 [Bacillota bacterium]|nr:hypothetical protein [Bacillota bacterium]
MNTAVILQRLEGRFPQDLDAVRAFLRMPSVSYTGEGIRDTATAVASKIEGLRGTARLVDVPGRVDHGAPRTLLVYGMHDGSRQHSDNKYCTVRSMVRFLDHCVAA